MLSAPAVFEGTADTEGAGYGPAKRACAGRAAVIVISVVGAAVPGAGISGVAVRVGAALGIFGTLCLVISDEGRNAGRRRGLGLLGLALFLLGGFDGLGKLLEKLLALGYLLLELFLRLLKVGLLFLDLGLIGLVFLLHGLGLEPCLLIALGKDTVALHDVAEVVDGGEKLAVAVGVEDEAEDIIASVFLHGADSCAVLFELLCLLGLCGFKLLRLLLDHFVVKLKLFSDYIKLLQGALIALLKRHFLVDDSGFLFSEGLELGVHIAYLAGDGVARLLKGAERAVIVLVGIGYRGDNADHERQQHKHRHDDGNGRNDFFPVFHKYQTLR